MRVSEKKGEEIARLKMRVLTAFPPLFILPSGELPLEDVLTTIPNTPNFSLS